MVDWTKSMDQTFEYYEVDPNTWKDKKLLNNIISCSINRDYGAETLGSASIDVTDMVGESYIRVYLITIQNGVREKHPLGTFLVQTPSVSFDGKISDVSMDAYTPLLELKENPTPLGYTLLEDENIMESAYKIVREHCRAPVVKTESDKKLISNFIANTNDKWLSFTTDLIAQANYLFDLDELGRIIFVPQQRLDTLQPVWTFDDGNSSILYPELTLRHDLYGIPNVVEVVCSTGTELHYSRIVNDDPNSPTSTVRRGREIIHRVTDPDISGIPTKEQIDEYARNLLESLSSVEYTVSFSHGYCPVRIGDCVRLNYEKAGLIDVKARIINQSIKCEPGCSVNATATFTKKLWK